MAKGSRGGRRGGGAPGAVATAVPTPAPQQGPVTFGKMDDTYANQLRDDMDDRYDADVTDAIKLYISDSDPNGDGYAHSQNMNYKLDQIAQGKNVKLNATEQFIDQNIQGGMHDIGKNVTLTRYCHEDILQQCGISDYSKMSAAQLKQKLVGLKFQTTSYDSYSYDVKKNPFRPGVSGGNGREVTMQFNAKADTKMVFGKKSQAEIIVNKGNKQIIKDVYYDGTIATPRGKGSKPRLVIVTESV